MTIWKSLVTMYMWQQYTEFRLWLSLMYMVVVITQKQPLDYWKLSVEKLESWHFFQSVQAT